VIIEGVNDDLFGAEVNVAKEEKAPEKVFGGIKTELNETFEHVELAGIDENPMDGVELHKGKKETEVENN
jgi:hypothetical protein